MPGGRVAGRADAVVTVGVTDGVELAVAGSVGKEDVDDDTEFIEREGGTDV
jgi:hypothetical protein